MMSAVDSPWGADAAQAFRRSLPADRPGLLRVYNLRLPFRLQVVARRGQHLLADERLRGLLEQGESVVVEPYHMLHYEGATSIDPRVGYQLHLAIHDDGRDAGTDGPGTASSPILAARVAHAVFCDPASDWSVLRAADRMRVGPRQLKAQLFRENSALTAIVREQRLMRALLALLAHPRARANLESAAGQFGFASVARLDDAFDEHFGSSASQIAALAWYPALTWSVAGAGIRLSGGPSCVTARGYSGCAVAHEQPARNANYPFDPGDSRIREIQIVDPLGMRQSASIRT